jgi:hypothetical protein
MLTRIMNILMAATLAGDLLATDAQARGGGGGYGGGFGGGHVRNFGPSSGSIGRANPGARDLARPTDPNQVFNLPGFVAPSQASPLGASQTFGR